MFKDHYHIRNYIKRSQHWKCLELLFRRLKVQCKLLHPTEGFHPCLLLAPGWPPIVCSVPWLVSVLGTEVFAVLCLALCGFYVYKDTVAPSRVCPWSYDFISANNNSCLPIADTFIQNYWGPDIWRDTASRTMAIFFCEQSRKFTGVYILWPLQQIDVDNSGLTDQFYCRSEILICILSWSKLLCVRWVFEPYFPGTYMEIEKCCTPQWKIKHRAVIISIYEKYNWKFLICFKCKFHIYRLLFRH